MNERNCEAYQALMMGLMDKELSPEESRSVNEHLIRCASCREEYDLLCESSRKLSGLSYTEPDEKILNKIWKSPYSRFGRNAALGMILAGWLLLMGFGIFTALTAPNEPVLPKIGMAAVLLGFVILLLSLIRERIRGYQNDPYKEVKR